MSSEASRDSELIWTVPIESLLDLADPLSDDVWGVGVITADEVIQCRDNSIGKTPYSQVAYGHDSRDYHIARISWLADNGWDNLEHPISVDLYADTSYTWHPIIDGNHRFAASLVLGRETIDVSVNGDIDFALEVLRPVNLSPTY